MEGMKAFGYFGLFKVTRCKSGTYISHHRGNGYVHLQKSLVTEQKSSLASQAPTGFGDIRY